MPIDANMTGLNVPFTNRNSMEVFPTTVDGIKRLKIVIIYEKRGDATHYLRREGASDQNQTDLPPFSREVVICLFKFYQQQRKMMQAKESCHGILHHYTAVAANRSSDAIVFIFMTFYILSNRFTFTKKSETREIRFLWR
jgi:hypothetical protein